MRAKSNSQPVARQGMGCWSFSADRSGQPWRVGLADKHQGRRTPIRQQAAALVTQRWEPCPLSLAQAMSAKDASVALGAPAAAPCRERANPVGASSFFVWHVRHGEPCSLRYPHTNAAHGDTWASFATHGPGPWHCRIPDSKKPSRNMACLNWPATSRGMREARAGRNPGNFLSAAETDEDRIPVPTHASLGANRSAIPGAALFDGGLPVLPAKVCSDASGCLTISPPVTASDKTWGGTRDLAAGGDQFDGGHRSLAVAGLFWPASLGWLSAGRHNAPLVRPAVKPDGGGVDRDTSPMYGAVRYGTRLSDGLARPNPKPVQFRPAVTPFRPACAGVGFPSAQPSRWLDFVRMHTEPGGTFSVTETEQHNNT